MTTFCTRCLWCSRSFEATTPRSHCSLPCEQRHRWYGVKPNNLRPQDSAAVGVQPVGGRAAQPDTRPAKQVAS